MSFIVIQTLNRHFTDFLGTQSCHLPAVLGGAVGLLFFMTAVIGIVGLENRCRCTLAGVLLALNLALLLAGIGLAVTVSKANLHCCGMHNASDYNNATAWLNANPGLLPASCSSNATKAAPVPINEASDIWSDGCAMKMKKKVETTIKANKASMSRSLATAARLRRANEDDDELLRVHASPEWRRWMFWRTSMLYGSYAAQIGLVILVFFIWNEVGYGGFLLAMGASLAGYAAYATAAVYYFLPRYREQRARELRGIRLRIRGNRAESGVNPSMEEDKPPPTYDEVLEAEEPPPTYELALTLLQPFRRIAQRLSRREPQRVDSPSSSIQASSASSNHLQPPDPSSQSQSPEPADQPSQISDTSHETSPSNNDIVHNLETNRNLPSTSDSDFVTISIDEERSPESGDFDDVRM